MLKNKKKQNDGAGGFISAGIPLVGFAIFSLIPLLLSLVISLTELHNADLSQMEFVGFENYITILTNADNHTYASYLSTLVYTLNVPICIGISLYIAYLLNNTKMGQKFFRSVFFIPYICSSVVIALMFKTMYNEYAGVLNAMLEKLGFDGIGWLTDSAGTFMGSAIFMCVWSGIGWCVVLYMAALSNVDASYYEAAKIDGASSFQIFWKITWPAVTPTTAYLITIKLIKAFQAMAETHLLSADMASGSVPKWEFFENSAWVSDLVVKHIYNMLFVKPYQYGYGVAAAAGWILAIIVFIITRVNLKLQERWVSHDF